MRTRRTACRAFSLIEVLIAILILALGLLGLGALFPVVIRQQRIGTEAIQGMQAAQAARAELEAMLSPAMLAAWRDLPVYPAPLTPPMLPAIPRRTTRTPNEPPGKWLVPYYVDDAPNTGVVCLGVGDATTALTQNQPATMHVIKVYDRLFPKDVQAFYPGGIAGTQPQFVWDVAVQRVPDLRQNPLLANNLLPQPGEPDAGGSLRFAIFVRRIDPRIRVPVANLPGANPARPMTLLDVLTDHAAVGAARARVPVAIDTTNNAYVLTQDGLGPPAGPPTYAQPMTVGVQFQYDPTSADDNYLHRDRLYLRSGASAVAERLWALARQVDQRLIDNLGTQYTVVEAGGDARRGWVRVTPEVPSFVTAAMAVPGAQPGRDVIQEVVFVPNVPAAVLVWTVKP
jgi:prepilin-type N-terminal cleavage/methylation domain-containing protein